MTDLPCALPESLREVCCAEGPAKVVKMLNGLQYTVVRKGKGIASFAGAKVCIETLLLRTDFGLWQMKVNYVGRLTKNKKVKGLLHSRPLCTYPERTVAGV